MAHITFSLLPDFLAAGLSGALADVEAVVEKAEKAPSQETVCEEVRADIDLPGALRWLRRRLKSVHAALEALVDLMPELFADCRATIQDFRRALDASSCPVLVHLRKIAEPHLQQLPPPLGFGPRRMGASPRGFRRQHSSGTDPPPTSW